MKGNTAFTLVPTMSDVSSVQAPAMKLLAAYIDEKEARIAHLERMVARLEDEEMALSVLKEERTIELNHLRQSLDRVRATRSDGFYNVVDDAVFDDTTPRTHGASSSHPKPPGSSKSPEVRGTPKPSKEEKQVNSRKAVRSSEFTPATISSPQKTPSRPRKAKKNEPPNLVGKRVKHRKSTKRPSDMLTNVSPAESSKTAKKHRVDLSTELEEPASSPENDPNATETESQLVQMSEQQLKQLRREMCNIADDGDAKEMERVIDMVRSGIDAKAAVELAVGPYFGYTPFMRVISAAPKEKIAACVALLSPYVRTRAQQNGLLFCTRGFRFKMTAVGMAYVRGDLDILEMVLAGLKMKRVKKSQLLLDHETKWSDFIAAHQTNTQLRAALEARLID